VIHFLWAEGVPGAKIHRMMSLQYGNSVMSQRTVCEWIERFKNGCTSVKHGKEPDATLLKPLRN
jgi:hypothetical protein